MQTDPSTLAPGTRVRLDPHLLLQPDDDPVITLVRRVDFGEGWWFSDGSYLYDHHWGRCVAL